MLRLAISLLCMSVLASATALAQGSGSSSNVARAKGERPFAVTKTVMGKITEIEKNKIVIENEEGAKKEFNLTSKTRFRLADKKYVKLNKFESGAMVLVTYREVDKTVTMVTETSKKFE